jgi:hypothetical protein
MRPGGPHPVSSLVGLRLFAAPENEYATSRATHSRVDVPRALPLFRIASCRILAAYLMRPMFRATTLITLEQEREDPLDIAASVARQRGPDVVSIETESRLLKSRDVLERIVRKLGLAEPSPPEGAESAAATPASVRPPSEIDPVTRAALGLQKSIEIGPVRGTSLLEVLVTARSAKKSADLANAATEAYIAWKVDRTKSEPLEFALRPWRMDISASRPRSVRSCSGGSGLEAIGA